MTEFSKQQFQTFQASDAPADAAGAVAHDGAARPGTPSQSENALQPIGVVITSEDRQYTLNKLYELRKLEAPTFDELSLILSASNPNEIWIIKRKPNAPSEAGPDETYPVAP